MDTNVVKTKAKAQLAGDEGRVKYAYQDTEGFWTIGIGCLIDRRNGGGLRDNEIDFIFNNRVDEKIAEIKRYIPWAEVNLDEARYGALLNMAFQLGVNGVLGFPHMLASLKIGDWLTVYGECINSKWAKQTPNRAKKVAQQFLTGEWQ